MGTPSLVYTQDSLMRLGLRVGIDRRAVVSYQFSVVRKGKGNSYGEGKGNSKGEGPAVVAGPFWNSY